MTENVHVQREAFNLLCDELIGSGAGRQVFSSKLLKDSVIKVESGAGSFQNIMEWETWNIVRDTEYAKHFAPCEFISPCGSVLVMAKTQTTRNYPTKVPVFFTDLKRANYGLYKNKFVCHDYGTNLMIQYGMTKRLKKADWWDL
jgi:hypothetical protein